MPRFSQKAKEIFEVIWYQADVNKAKKLMKELKNPLDIAFGKIWIARDSLVFKRQTEFLKIISKLENESKELKDRFIQFLIYYLYILYYSGFNAPIIDCDQVKKYLNNMEETYHALNHLDDWEKYFSEGWYYYSKAFYLYKVNINLSDAIKFQKMCIDSFSKVPQDGKFLSEYNHLNMGQYYLEDGNFEEAEKSFKISLEVTVEYNHKMQSWLMGSLSWLNFLKGDLRNAREYNNKSLKSAKRDNNLPVIIYGLMRKALLLQGEGNYNDPLKAYQEGLVYRKQHGNPLEIFWGYFNIFDFYYKRFKITRDKAFFTQAEQTLTDLQELRKTHSDNKVIVSYTDYAQALIFKFGNIRKKGKAIDIIEELVDAYPNEIGMTLELLELLFEDFFLSEDPDIIDQIDRLMEKVNQIPLRNNPQAIFSFISQQIILAKYIYYIKGHASVALNILYNAKDHINTYKLDNLVNELDAEIEVLEKELTRWDNVDMSIKERIKSSEFNKYIQHALSIADKKM